MTEKEKAIEFRRRVLARVDAPEGYGYGKENRRETDCSGTICGPLIEMGCKIRTTADELYRKIFTKLVRARDELDLDRIMAIFYVMKKPWKKLEGTKMPAGTVIHVTPVVGEHAVVDADYSRDQIIIKTVEATRLYYERFGAKAVWRQIDWDAAKKYNGILYYNPDPELYQNENGTD